jgi:hypothetical protein
MSSILFILPIVDKVNPTHKIYIIIEIFVLSPGTLINGNLGYLSIWIECGYNNEDG